MTFSLALTTTSTCPSVLPPTTAPRFSLLTTVQISAALAAVRLLAYLGLAVAALCVLIVAYCFTLTWLALLWLQTHLLVFHTQLLRLTIDTPLPALQLRRTEEAKNDAPVTDGPSTEPSATETSSRPLAEEVVTEKATEPFNDQVLHNAAHEGYHNADVY